MSINALNPCLRNRRARAFDSTRYSVISLHPYQFKAGTNFSIKITLTAYCQLRFISKSVARRFMVKKWLAVSRMGRHIFVEEICTEEIDQYLGIKNKPC